jgi:hypothetical protein
MKEAVMPFRWFTILFALLVNTVGQANDASERWELADRSTQGDVAVTLFVESEATVGRPAFKIETTFDVSPFVAVVTLMDGMVSASDVPPGQRRRILERSEHEAIVYTFIDLPFLLSDRELALRIVHTENEETGIHRVDWVEANDVLPAVQKKVVRLSGATGFWEFRPDGQGGTLATHVTQAEIGGSIPASIGDRLMRSQALNTVERLRSQIRIRKQTHVAGSAPVRESGPD